MIGQQGNKNQMYPPARDEEFEAKKPHLVKRLEKAEAKLNLTEPIWRSIEFKQKNIIKNLFQILIQKINNQRTS